MGTIMILLPVTEKIVACCYRCLQWIRRYCSTPTMRRFRRFLHGMFQWSWLQTIPAHLTLVLGSPGRPIRRRRN